MTRIEQYQIARDILAGLQSTVQDAFDAGKVPEEWDGIEIRQWIADLARERYAGYNMGRGRLKAYQNARMVTAGL